MTMSVQCLLSIDLKQLTDGSSTTCCDCEVDVLSVQLF